MIPENMDFENEPPRRSVPFGAVLAVIVIAVGTILFLDRNGIIDAWKVLRYWPLVLVGLGVLKLAQRDTGSRAVGIILVVIGVLNSGWAIDYAVWSTIWPLLLIGVGVLLLWNALSRRHEEVDATAESARLSEWTLFGGGERKISSPEFERGDLLAIFGGFDVDLRRAGMKGPRAVIDANCLFGGMTIRVPEDWTVALRGVGIFGGYSDSTRHPRAEEVPFSKRLVVKGFAIFGGVDVRN